MKRFLILCLLAVLLSGIVNADDAAAQTEETACQYFDIGNPINFGGKDYYFAWSSRPYDFYIIQEYLPKGEKFEDYTQMLTASVMFYGDAPFDSAKAVEFKIAALEEVKQKDPMCSYLLLEDNGEYILDFIVSKSDKKGELEFVEMDIHYYKDININGINASYLVFYSMRAYGDDIAPFLESIPSQRENWYKDIKDLKITPKFQFKKF